MGWPESIFHVVVLPDSSMSFGCHSDIFNLWLFYGNLLLLWLKNSYRGITFAHWILWMRFSDDAPTQLRYASLQTTDCECNQNFFFVTVECHLFRFPSQKSNSNNLFFSPQMFKQLQPAAESSGKVAPHCLPRLVGHVTLRFFWSKVLLLQKIPAVNVVILCYSLFWCWQLVLGILNYIFIVVPADWVWWVPNLRHKMKNIQLIRSF